MTEANSALAGKVTSIVRIAYRKLTDAPSRLTDDRKEEQNLFKASFQSYCKQKTEVRASVLIKYFLKPTIPRDISLVPFYTRVKNRNSIIGFPFSRE